MELLKKTGSKLGVGVNFTLDSVSPQPLILSILALTDISAATITTFMSNTGYGVAVVEEITASKIL